MKYLISYIHPWQGSIIQHFDWSSSKFIGCLDLSYGPVSLSAASCRSSLDCAEFCSTCIACEKWYLCWLIFYNQNLCMPKEVAADPEFPLCYCWRCPNGFLQIDIMESYFASCFLPSLETTVLKWDVWCPHWLNFFICRNLQNNQLNGNLPLSLLNLTNLQTLWVLLFCCNFFSIYSNSWRARAVVFAYKFLS